MSERDDSVTDPLSVLGNEHRVAIVRALADADGPLSFTDLRERAGFTDPGRFNYHLGELESYFVRKGPDGYELGHAGTRVLSAVDPVETPSNESACPVCGDEDCERLFHVHLTPG